MFAVVVLHTASPLLFRVKDASINDWLAADVYNAVVRFSVPVFVMITGALLLQREYELGDFLKRRFGRLIPPFIFWSLTYIGYKLYNEEIELSNNIWPNIKLILQQLQTGSYYHLWYVYLLMGLYLFIPVISKFVRNATEKELLYFLGIWFLTVILSRPYLTMFDPGIDLHNFTGYIGYLVLGYYLAYKPFKFKNIALIAALVFVLCALLITLGTYFILLKNKDLNTFFYEPISPFIIILSSGAFLMARFIKVNLNPVVNNIISNIGKYTLGLYLSHALILNVLELNDITYKIFNPVFSIPLVALLTFSLSSLLIFVMSKLPLLKYVAG
ncbi:Surface polysaccharide O-acyltransferase, integral membrane enzyme [Mucilaginibacter gossypiicola]|uniref:Surface polysaccharide O-acyltransferase, integral membrane enzyme n=2 Tax=Mucilaginibacter gossypiicola TaxID=551995 RepID=A0A1H8ASJ3_9SPHI|nr:Surface polysaccharide O-acyltransferase, integral membrane enzyme [Mucilaginibacter gossypiicola]